MDKLIKNRIIPRLLLVSSVVVCLSSAYACGKAKASSFDALDNEAVVLNQLQVITNTGNESSNTSKDPDMQGNSSSTIKIRTEVNGKMIDDFKLSTSSSEGNIAINLKRDLSIENGGQVVSDIDLQTDGIDGPIDQVEINKNFSGKIDSDENALDPSKDIVPEQRSLASEPITDPTAPTKPIDNQSKIINLANGIGTKESSDKNLAISDPNNNEILSDYAKEETMLSKLTGQFDLIRHIVEEFWKLIKPLIMAYKYQIYGYEKT